MRANIIGRHFFNSPQVLRWLYLACHNNFAAATRECDWRSVVIYYVYPPPSPRSEHEPKRSGPFPSTLIVPVLYIFLLPPTAATTFGDYRVDIMYKCSVFVGGLPCCAEFLTMAAFVTETITGELPVGGLALPWRQPVQGTRGSASWQ